jgi:hypothetical protein
MWLETQRLAHKYYRLRLSGKGGVLPAICYWWIQFGFREAVDFSLLSATAIGELLAQHKLSYLMIDHRHWGAFGHFAILFTL